MFSGKVEAVLFVKHETKGLRKASITITEHKVLHETGNLSQDLTFYSQICGVSDTTMALDGSAIYEIEKVSPKLVNCENSFMMTNFPPNSSQTQDLWIPDISTFSSSKVSQRNDRLIFF